LNPLAGLSGEFAGLDLVYVTPDPGLARFDRTHQRMFGVVEMLGRMFVLGRIATGGMSANKAHAQMDPRISSLHAVFADMFIGFSYFDLIKMGTFLLWHRFLLIFRIAL
jgi:hypothetical protein